MKNLEKGLILIKVLFSLFVSYLIIFKGDAGSLVHTVGAFITNGNFTIGLIFTITILVIYSLLLHNLTFNVANLSSLKNKLLAFDIIVIVANLILSIFISNKIYQMPLDDAQSKYGILTVGSALLYITFTVVILIILRKMNYKEKNNQELCINNNPLSFTGKMHRLSYFVTKLLLAVFAIVLAAGCNFILNPTTRLETVMCQSFVLTIIFLLALFAASKRLRDIKWSQWLLLIWAIPYIGLVIGIPLLLIKSKTDNALNQK